MEYLTRGISRLQGLSESSVLIIILIMLDLKFIRENLEAVRENISKRNAAADADRVMSLYTERNRLMQELETLRRNRNENARKMKGKVNPQKRELLIDAGKKLKEAITLAETSLTEVKGELDSETAKIPNMSHPSAPPGQGDENNREIKQCGSIPKFSFEPRDHVEIAQTLDLIDFENATKVSGPKFYFLKNEAVILEYALIRYVLDLLSAEEFTLTQTPDIAREEIVTGIGYNPRGAEADIYALEGTGTCLIGTAEITLGGLFSDQILPLEELPIKMCGVSHCFRREAGAAGKYSKGLYRVHQFTKVEMFIFCHPKKSEEMHDYLLKIEEKIFSGLEIPFRVVDTCTGELGGPAYRKYDLEAWMPGRGCGGEWGEITSTSNCTDYQARRLSIRFKEQGKTAFVHMLNGTAIANSRALIALLENFQRADGSVAIPEKLQEYTGFSEICLKK